MFKVNKYLFLLLLSCAANAQLNDSINLSKNEHFAEVKSFVWENPMIIKQLNLRNYTKTSVNIDFKDLNIKRQQTPEEVLNYNFSSEGLYHFSDKVSVFGDFSFTKQNEKNFGYNLSSNRTENQMVLPTNYYYSPKKADWTNQFYAFNGGIVYDITEALAIGAKAKYRNETLARKSDPRPKITSNEMGFDGFIAYTLGKHTLQVGGLYNQKDELTTIYFENTFLNPSSDPLYYIKLATGYGYNIYDNTYNKFNNVDLTKGFNAGYTFKSDTQAFSVFYEYSKSMNNFYQKNEFSSNSNTPIQTEENVRYKLRTLSNKINALYIKSFGKDQLIANAKINFSKQANFNTRTFIQNYQLKNQNLTLNVNYLKDSQTDSKTAFGTNIILDNLTAKDLLGMTNKQINSLEFSIFANKEFRLNKNNKLFAHLEAGTYQLLKNELDYKAITQDQDFANNVIIHDHIYDGTSKLLTKAKLYYDIQLRKGKTLRINIDYQNLSALKNNKQEQQINGTNHYINTGISIFY